MEKEAISDYLTATAMLDFLHPSVQSYVLEFRDLSDKKEQAIAIYQKVRDGFLYDPYHLDLHKQVLTASAIIGKTRAWCVEKSIVCCAALRALEIPSRLGFGIVRNHIGVEKLQKYLRKDEIVFHGFVEVFLDGKWTKCTPAFDRRICKLNKVEPLEWTGDSDSLFQEYRGAERYMEYVHFYGVFADVPLQLMHEEMYVHYPHLFNDPIATPEFSFHFETDFLKTKRSVAY